MVSGSIGSSVTSAERQVPVITQSEVLSYDIIDILIVCNTNQCFNDNSNYNMQQGISCKTTKKKTTRPSEAKNKCKLHTISWPFLMKNSTLFSFAGVNTGDNTGVNSAATDLNPTVALLFAFLPLQQHLQTTREVMIERVAVTATAMRMTFVAFCPIHWKIEKSQSSHVNPAPSFQNTHGSAPR